MTKEQKFYDALSKVFVGERIEGESGYINLMKIKSRYYKDFVFPKLKSDISNALTGFYSYREELFDKLFTFFESYFSESGSIYFRYTPVRKNIYEKVYTDDKDVILFWKTHMLYYVKTERLFKSLEVNIDGIKFLFDVSNLEHKKANEKKDIIYELKEKSEDGVLVFNVYYSGSGRKTNFDDILKEIKKLKGNISEEVLERAFNVFERQSEVDFFINKNARGFLREQFDMWLYQYVFSGESQWTEVRIKQIQALKDIAFKIIDFISQFEDELVRIWNKPKFVFNSNYVITLDRIAEKDKSFALVKKIIEHKRFDEQEKEWKELGIIDDDFDKEDIIENDLTDKHLGKKYRFLPIDTKYFKDLELEILGLFDDLDNALDGWLIKSENYQALNTILQKFKEKVQTIYIDPPFNKEENADYFYNVKYKDASWITILENRLMLAKQFLDPKGCTFVRCDYNGNMFARSILSNIFGEDNFRNEIVVNRFKRQLHELTRLNIATDSLLYYGKSPTSIFNSDFRKRICTFCGKEMDPDWRPMSSPGLRRPPERTIFDRVLLPPKGRHWTFTQAKISQMKKEGRIRINSSLNYVDLEGNRINGLPEYLQTEETPIDSNWTDLKGYAFGSTFPTENAEELLARVIKISSNQGDLIFDFFLGSGTTMSVAHKLKRKWIGIEMEDYLDTIIMEKMKKVLAGKNNGISEEVDYKAGGFFKYYELEQYEDTLRKAKYEDSDLFDDPRKTPYNQYVFMKDLKMLDALEVDYENDKVNVDLSKLYPNIDISETLSNLLGKWIKRITPEFVEFEDGEKIDLLDLDYKLIQHLIWW